MKPSLRTAFASGEFVLAPGVHDLIAAAVFRRHGFRFAYASGYWMTASAYGLPDAGLVTYTQMVDRVRLLAGSLDAGLIADADTGYGGLLNVHHTVRGYEEAGVVGIQIEDQEFPKKCGHTPYKRVVPVADMVAKIKVACEARRNPVETLIIARSDARQTDGFAGMVRRLQAYSDAGADVLFAEALESDDEMREVCRLFDKPMMANMADGGLTPIRPASELQQIGYSMAIFPATSALAAAQAVDGAFAMLARLGTSSSPDLPLFPFSQFNRLIGFEDIWEFERKWNQQ